MRRARPRTAARRTSSISTRSSPRDRRGLAADPLQPAEPAARLHPRGEARLAPAAAVLKQVVAEHEEIVDAGAPRRGNRARALVEHLHKSDYAIDEKPRGRGEAMSSFVPRRTCSTKRAFSGPSRRARRGRARRRRAGTGRRRPVARLLRALPAARRSSTATTTSRSRPSRSASCCSRSRMGARSGERPPDPRVRRHLRPRLCGADRRGIRSSSASSPVAPADLGDDDLPDRRSRRRLPRGAPAEVVADPGVPGAPAGRRDGLDEMRGPCARRFAQGGLDQAGDDRRARLEHDQPLVPS